MTNSDHILYLLREATPHLREIVFHSDGRVMVKSGANAPHPKKLYTSHESGDLQSKLTTALVKLVRDNVPCTHSKEVKCWLCPPNPKCKYCYDKKSYSRFSAGGTFGDSFDGHVTLQPKIENIPCPRCQRPTSGKFKGERHRKNIQKSLTKTKCSTNTK